ncbi:BAH_G0012490.mRNA.1.CDS.1 [Saccharomyces cerevisiae]|nr:SX2_G0047680.mRNA.1.CDS.1 [Saccharomyces cerevisiae]CAI4369243.1 BAG_1a_G0012630.mRNA.1.CDS.1 [Saccharomyces cerevisiae]CAI4369761.1 BAH_G0012490.mRNA.1.CDS.1 [Saccharomyces cerevisiae]CAI7083026.1 BAH_G0012490.mRNA.1.CDS.1 [Saccharomyces cerevisiae]CAI7083555.1 BAG_1a_G0012630.mRNA.1.CDS.1 [Saccharomyces cerevisiae]
MFSHVQHNSSHVERPSHGDPSSTSSSVLHKVIIWGYWNMKVEMNIQKIYIIMQEIKEELDMYKSDGRGKK